MTTPAAQNKEIISFGPFRLIVSERLLTNSGVPVELSGRAFDILLALLSRPTEVVSKSDLMDRVWPGVTVEEGSLRFHIANLRKALGDGKDGARYITTASGRGYCFVAPVSWADEQSPPPKFPGPAFRHANLPSRSTMIDREDDFRKLSEWLHTERFVTIVGSGGVGKTTLAIALGHHMMHAFAGAVLFVDLSMLSDPDLVATVMASMLGLSVQSADATPSLITHLRDKRMLLILDTCEHLIETVAALASAIFETAPQVHILATSRETLQVEGEHVYRLEPLACPPDDEVLTAAVARTFPATQLFLDRARASGAQLDFSDAEAAIVVRHLPQARRRGSRYRTGGAADRGLWRASDRGAARPAADAVVGRVSEPRRRAKRPCRQRWTGVTSCFPTSSAWCFAGSRSSSASLRSMRRWRVATSATDRPFAGVWRHRQPGRKVDDRDPPCRRHDALPAAGHHAGLCPGKQYRRRRTRRHSHSPCDLLPAMAGAERKRMAKPDDRGGTGSPLYRVSTTSARRWNGALAPTGMLKSALDLAAAAAPVFLTMSLLTECHRWSERALYARAAIARGDAEEMHLQASLGMSLMFLHGVSDAARVALNRSLAIAEARGDTLNQLQLLGRLHMFHVRIGNFNAALECARRSTTVSRNITDPAATALAHSFLGISLSYLCDLDDARVEIEQALLHGAGGRTDRMSLGFDHYNMAAAYIARTLWLQGHPAQAVARTRQTVKDAAGMDHPVTLCISLMWAVSVFLWVGDLQSAEEHVDWLVSQAETYSLAPYLALGRGYKGELAIRQGNPAAGVEMLRSCLEDLLPTRYEVMATPFNISIVQGPCGDRPLHRRRCIDRPDYPAVEMNGDLCYMPERFA